MSKFIKNLTLEAKGIKLQRAQIMAKEACEHQLDLIKNLEREKRQLESELLNLTDLSPENVYSLRPGSKDYDSKQWVKRMQEIKIAQLELDIQLQVAQENYNEWFEDEETKDLS